MSCFLSVPYRKRVHRCFCSISERLGIPITSRLVGGAPSFAITPQREQQMHYRVVQGFLFDFTSFMLGGCIMREAWKIVVAYADGARN